MNLQIVKTDSGEGFLEGLTIGEKVGVDTSSRLGYSSSQNYTSNKHSLFYVFCTGVSGIGTGSSGELASLLTHQNPKVMLTHASRKMNDTFKRYLGEDLGRFMEVGSQRGDPDFYLLGGLLGKPNHVFDGDNWPLIVYEDFITETAEFVHAETGIMPRIATGPDLFGGWQHALVDHGSNTMLITRDSVDNGLARINDLSEHPLSMDELPLYMAIWDQGLDLLELYKKGKIDMVQYELGLDSLLQQLPACTKP